jgi:hypothetical protein
VSAATARGSRRAPRRNRCLQMPPRPSKAARRESESDGGADSDDDAASSGSEGSGSTSSSAAQACDEVTAAMSGHRDTVADALSKLDDLRAYMAGLTAPVEAVDAERLADPAYLRASPFRHAPVTLTPAAGAAFVAAGIVASPATTFELLSAGLRAYVVNRGLAEPATGAIRPDALLRRTLVPDAEADAPVSFIALLAGARHVVATR